MKKWTPESEVMNKQFDDKINIMSEGWDTTRNMQKELEQIEINYDDDFDE